MKTYELIIEKNQPACGGKDPRILQFETAVTDDPVAYVKQKELDAKNLEVDDDGKGTITVSFQYGVQRVKYEFSEE